MNKRLHIYYSGLVQGVGFRYTAQQLASSLGLTGWVRNMDDGRVEILCEGKEPALEALLTKLKGIFKEYIRGIDSDRGAATGEFDNFDIRF